MCDWLAVHGQLADDFFLLLGTKILSDLLKKGRKLRVNSSLISFRSVFHPLIFHFLCAKGN